MKFNGSSGRKPSAEARRYVYRILATSLENDVDNGSAWMFENLDEADQRRVKKAVEQVVDELRRKATR